MISDSNNKINWDLLNEQVDPLYNHADNAIDTSSNRAIGVNADHRENSMASLNRNQLDNKKRLEQRYSDNQLDPIFCSDCDNQIKQYILDGYAKNPAMYEGLELPLEYDEDLNASDEVRQAYYQNPWHTAYRYFVLTIESKPNLWLDPNAEYMGQLEYNGKYYKTPQIQDNYRALIRAMWLAVNDPEFTLSEMHTPETAKLELINVFAALGRAHNWDQTRWVTKQVKGRDGIVREQQIEEEYDNLGLDYPSCPWGLEQRLTQYVMLVLKEDANERTLNSLVIRQKFKEEMISEIEGKRTIFGEIAKMDLPTLNKLNDALLEFVVINTGDFDALDGEQQALLRQIQCYTTKDIENFLNGCKAFFGNYRLTQKLPQKVTYQDLSFNNYGLLALEFARDPWTLFYDAIAENINKRITQLSDAKVNDAPASQAVAAEPIIEPKIEQEQHLAQLPQQIVEADDIEQDECKARQLVIDYAFELGDADLAEHMLDASADEVFIALERIREAKHRLEADLAFARQLEQEAEALEQQEMARLQAEQERQQEEAARLAFSRLEAEQQRLQIAQRLQQEAEQRRQALETRNQRTLTLSYDTNLNRQIASPAVKPELQALFVNDIAKLLLLNINQNEATINMINSWQKELVERLITGLGTDSKMTAFQKMNTPTKLRFFEQFADKYKPTARAIMV